MTTDKITASAVRARNAHCVSVGYCSLYNTLRICGSRDFHTEGYLGWNADIYEFDDFAIVTGYRPFGAYSLSLKFIKKWEKKAEAAYAKLYACDRKGNYPNADKIAIRRLKFRLAFAAAVRKEIGLDTAENHTDNGVRAA